MIHKEDIQDIYGLSPMQKSMLFDHAIDPSSSAYTEQFDFHIRGDLNPERLERALSYLMERYDILRTVFSYRKTDQPRQVVLKSRLPEWTVKDLTHAANPEELVELFKEEDRKRGFDLSKDVLIRGAVLRTGNAAWHFIFSFHHIVMDGWSLAPFFQELFDLYEYTEVTLEAKDTHSFREYIRWLELQDDNQARHYWRDYLEGYEKKATVPCYEPTAEHKSNRSEKYKHATHIFRLPELIANGMRVLARTRQITVNSIFQTAWGVLLQKYNYTHDVVFGNVVAGRPPELNGVESMKGLFINTLPLRICTEEGDSFASLCAKVQKDIFRSTSFEYYPLYEIQGQSQLKNKLLDHVVAFENYPLAERLQDLGADRDQSFYIEDVKVFERSNYDFNIIVNPGDNFVVNFIYNANKFTKETMNTLERSLIHLLENATVNPDNFVKDLGLCSPTDIAQIVETLNPGNKLYPSDSTVDQAFRGIASKYPRNTAVIFHDQAVTYEELDKWSDRLSQQLREKGLGPDSTAGIFMPRCPEMVAGILGILKTGASYVPLDLANSPERLRFMMEDAEIKVLCTRTDLLGKVPHDYELILLDKPEYSYVEEASPVKEITTEHKAENQAYIMYTSGSTGKPKGCKISHKNIISLVYGQDYIDFGPHQVILQVASPAFDVSTFEIWGALLHGGTLVLPDAEEILDASLLKKLLVRTSVQSMVLTSSLFNRLCDQDPTSFQSLRNLIVGGEALSVAHIGKIMRINPKLNVINGYGPTENSTLSTTHSISERDLQRERIPIGKPLINSRAYIVDTGLNLLPVGAIGELCVAGDGVGLGYHNRVELTETFFLDDPLVPGERMYRTGDLAQLLPDGTIEYLGRTDAQVKIRGYRVELGEIERAMMNLPNIKQVTIQIREIGQERHICAYYTADGEHNVRAWRENLLAVLPEYMVPIFFTQLENLPLTINGKVDHHALPAPEVSQPASGSQVRPLSEVEKEVAEICASVLGVKKEDIGANDKLFEIGANSLNMISINNRLKEKFQREIALTALFELTSIASIAEHLQKTEVSEQALEEDKDSALDAARSSLMKTATLIKRMEGR